MDLELTDEQTWLSESIETLLARNWPGHDAAAADDRRRTWAALVDFGVLRIGGDDGLGTVDLCLIANVLGRALGAVPLIGSAAMRLALAPDVDELGPEAAELLAGDASVALALLEPGQTWDWLEPSTSLVRTGDGFVLSGLKVGVEYAAEADRLAVIAALDDVPVLVLVDAQAPGVTLTSQVSFDPAIPVAHAAFDAVAVGEPDVFAGAQGPAVLARLRMFGALLAAAEAVGAAAYIADGAAGYAAQRRQFGRTIASFQSVRHLLADMYVGHASGWSTVLYAAAAADGAEDDVARTIAIAKAYVSRRARAVVHDAIQVFGGVAITAEHPAHRYLRRVVVRERAFGDAAFYERRIGEALARAAEADQAVAVGAR